MNDYSSDFLKAFNYAMRHEVGPWWDPADPAVISGSIATRADKKKVGYVDDPVDRGGETKYGIAARSNPSLNIASLDIYDAVAVYHNSYWVAGKCNKLSGPLAMLHFDGCVNHGPGRAIKFLQLAAGVEADGVFGDLTEAAVSTKTDREMIDSICEQRENFYLQIVARDASQARFLNGWKNRITHVKEFCSSRIE